MLDTYGRKFFDKLFDKLSDVFIYLKLSKNQITGMALVFGILSGILVYFKIYIASFIFLWLSGLFDVLDGEVARKTNKSSLLGAQFDIISDRVVELVFIWGLALSVENIQYELLLLVSMILMSMTVFLTTGMISKNNTRKSFYYQAGLMERTEGFIMFSLMIFLNKYIKKIIIIYSILIFVTIIQRIYETLKINKKEEVYE